VSSPGRFVTTVPQQALFMMNSPFAVEQARRLAARPEVAGAKSDDDRVRELYRIVYARQPEPQELQLALGFLRSGSGDGPSAAQKPVWQYGYGLVNESTGRTATFQPLTQFVGQTWQGGPALPDPKTGWASLNARGGHPGNDLSHAVIRRWVAPADGTYTVTGIVVHGNEKGDGIRARIISSRGGILGTWMVHNNRTPANVTKVELRAGDTLDFVVDCRTSPDSDSFTWAPSIRIAAGTPIPASLPRTEWSAAEAFSGPQDAAKGLSPCEKLAQVLLMSNEFAFVD
jgi:hypothetical protein